MSGACLLEMRRPRLQGRVRWDKNIPLSRDALTDVWSPYEITRSRETVGESASLDFHVKCPRCDFLVHISNTRVDQSDKLKRCGMCRRGYPLSAWRCSCGERWVLCERHNTYTPCNRSQRDLAQSVEENSGGARQQYGNAHRNDAKGMPSSCKRKHAQQEGTSTNIEMGMLKSRFRPDYLKFSESLRHRFAHLCETNARASADCNSVRASKKRKAERQDCEEAL